VLSVFDNCKSDEQKMLQDQLRNKNSNLRRLRSILEQIDVTGTGAIHVDGLNSLLFDTMVTDVLDDMEMDTSEVAGIFKLLDVDDSGYVNIDELLITMFRLHAQTQGVDLPSLLHESRKVGCHLMNATKASEDGVSDVKKSSVPN